MIRQGTECRQGASSYSDLAGFRVRVSVPLRRFAPSVWTDLVLKFPGPEWVHLRKKCTPCFRVPKSRCSVVFWRNVGPQNERPTRTLAHVPVSGPLNRAVAPCFGETLVPQSGPRADSTTDAQIGSCPEHHESKGAPKFSAPIPISDLTP